MLGNEMVELLAAAKEFLWVFHLGICWAGCLVSILAVVMAILMDAETDLH